MERAPWSRSNWPGTTFTACGTSRSGALPLVAVVLAAGE